MTPSRFLFLLSLSLGLHAAAVNLPVNLTVPADSAHTPGTATDRVTGRISAPSGVSVQYEMAGIPPPGQAVVRARFRNRAVTAGRAPGARWLREENINGYPAYLACDAQGVLHASFPSEAVNLTVRVAGADQVGEALAIIRSFGRTVEPAAPAPTSTSTSTSASTSTSTSAPLISVR